MPPVNVVRIERQLDDLRRDLDRRGRTEASGHLAAAIKHLRLARSVAAEVPPTGQYPVSFSLPPDALDAVRARAAAGDETQTRFMIRAFERALESSLLFAEPVPQERSDARVSLRVPAELLRRIDEHATRLATTRSRMLREAVIDGVRDRPRPPLT
jgi:hypothetical protein